MKKRTFIGDGVKVLLWSWIGGGLFLWLSRYPLSSYPGLVKIIILLILFRCLSMWLSGIYLSFGHLMNYKNFKQNGYGPYRNSSPSPWDGVMVFLAVVSILAILTMNIIAIYEVFATESIGLGFFGLAIGIAAGIFGIYAFQKELNS